VAANGPPRLIAAGKWPADRPFIVLSPQHGGTDCPGPAEVDAFLTFALARYTIDTKRVYLTGLSCGAIGSWNYLGQFRGQRVVAAVLIAGDGRGAWQRAMCNLGEVAIWAFHGDADPTVPIAGDVQAMNNLMACPMPPRKEALFTIYPGVGHDSWSRTYDLSAGHDIYTWLLKFSK
jgi:predicted peptidase